MNKVLIANRGEIALRIIRSCQRLGLATVAVYSDADREALHVAASDEAYCIGPAAPEQSYLDIAAVLAVAARSGADAVHPGYGFLSENPLFAKAVQAAGLIWVGPPAAAMEKMASKISARNIALAHDLPVLPAVVLAAEDAVDDAGLVTEVGLPLLLKASAGGGGIGMREVHAQTDLGSAIEEVRAQALRQFGSADLLLEHLVSGARHVEVQILADQHGNVVHLFERDCSTQRRRQKLLEEAPAPNLAQDTRGALHRAAVALASAVAYEGVGTVEFLLRDEQFFLLEMNTRLQVEHGVTEEICGLDLVALQFAVAAGKPLPLTQADIHSDGHAIEARIYAENPAAAFHPLTGTVAGYCAAEQQGLRVDPGVAEGSTVGHHYDGLLCKLIAHGDDREAATRKLLLALNALRLQGVGTNQRLLRAVLHSASWQSGCSTTTLEDELEQLVAASLPQSGELALALAAATIWQFRRQPPAADRQPWPGGYREARLALWTCEGEHHRLQWRWTGSDSFAFQGLAGEATVHSWQESEGRLALEVDGQRHAFHVSEQSGDLWLWERGLGNLVLRAGAAGSNDIDPLAAGHCTSHGPGLVLRILVSPGQEVAAGEALVVLESMKMESTLSAARAGRVVEVPVTEGDLIDSGQLLVRLDASEEVLA